MHLKDLASFTVLSFFTLFYVYIGEIWHQKVKSLSSTDFSYVVFHFGTACVCKGAFIREVLEAL